MSTNLDRTRLQLRTPKTDDGRIPFHPILMMHAAYLNGHTYEEFMRDHRILVEDNLRALEVYDHDAVSVISDPFRETSAFGAKIHFDGNSSPRAEKLINSAADIEALQIPDVGRCERTLDRIEGVALFRQKLGARFPVIGWVEGALAEAADLMGMEDVMMQMMLDPGMVHGLCDKTQRVAEDFAVAQIDAGANIIGVGDAICSQIPPEMYAEFAFARQKELFRAIHERGALVKLHICGDIIHLLPYLAQLDVDILDVDHMVDMPDAYRTMGPEVMLCGNLDPVSVIMKGDRQLIRTKFEQVRAAIPLKNWIVMGGCEIPMFTPKENMTLLREISRTEAVGF
ncbi:hypothetical protein FACS1894159_11690 [Bacteroidia bacterium]|nr:hypothetical protein FACS1894159_11690 [Bacteroidia bacterium]